MPGFFDKAVERAAAIAALPGVLVTPNPPQATAMIIAVQGTRTSWSMRQSGWRNGPACVSLISPVISSFQGMAMIEITVRKAALDIAVEEAVQAVALLQELTGAA